MGLYDFTFYGVINRNAFCFKDRPAWYEVDQGLTLTFSQYKEKVDRLALGLQKAGIEKGDRIGVLGKNSLEFFLLYGAAAAVGATMLPINWRLSGEEVAYNLDDCGAKVLFVDQEYQETVEGVKDKLPSVGKYFNLGPAGGTYADFGALMEYQGDFEPADVSTDDGFVIIHTAGVAGRPRGALLSHGNLLCLDMHFDYVLNLTPQDVHLNILPLFHVAGLFLAAAGFHAGALNVNMSRFDAVKAVGLIEEKRVSFMYDFTPILGQVVEEHEKTGKDISSLKKVMGLEEPKTIEKFQEITGGNFYCLYGQTETSSLTTISPYREKPGSAGKVLPLAEVQIVDDYGGSLPVGQVGEITMKGPMIFQGYWGLPKDNEYTFRGGWHHTGDMGRFDEEGYLWYAGRKSDKELIKPGGENVYPAEVEKVVLEHPAIETTVVFGVPDPKWKEGIKAVCVLKAGETLEPQELIDFVGARIARFKKPGYVEFVTDLPLLEDGSPDRVKIRELYGGEQH